MRGVRWRRSELSFSGAGPVRDKCSSNYKTSVLSSVLSFLLSSHSCCVVHFPDHLIPLFLCPSSPHSWLPLKGFQVMTAPHLSLLLSALLTFKEGQYHSHILYGPDLLRFQIAGTKLRAQCNRLRVSFACVLWVIY